MAGIVCFTSGPSLLALLGSSFITSVSGNETSPKPAAQLPLFPEGLHLAKVHCKGCRKAAKLIDSPKASFAQKVGLFFSRKCKFTALLCRNTTKLKRNCKMPGI